MTSKIKYEYVAAWAPRWAATILQECYEIRAIDWVTIFVPTHEQLRAVRFVQALAEAQGWECDTAAPGKLDTVDIEAFEELDGEPVVRFRVSLRPVEVAR